MSIKYRKLVGLLMVLAVVCSLVAITAAPTSAASFVAPKCASSGGTPSVLWSAQSAYPGQSITGNGSGFTPGAAITATLNGITLTAATTVIAGTGADPYNWFPGNWTGSFTIPDMPAGNYTGSNTLIATDTALSSCADWFSVVPKLKVSPTTVGVGGTVTLTGRGFTYPGTATAAFARVQDGQPAGTLITSPIPIQILSNGTFSATFVMPEPTLKDGNGNYTITVTDSAGKGNSTNILLTPSIQLIPSTGLPGQNFTVQGSDFPAIAGSVNLYWQAPPPGNATPLVRGVAIVANAFIQGCVIPTTALTGQYYVWAVAGPDYTVGNASNSAKALMTVGTLGITLTPSSAAPGSTITLQGSGFTQTGTAILASVTFGSVCAPITGPTTIPMSGTITTTIVVPPLDPGTYTVVVTDNGAGVPANAVFRTGAWTVAAPTIMLSPAGGPTNTLLGITGSGWIPTTNAINNSLTGTVSVSVGGGAPITAPVAPNGRFSVTTLVPTGLSTGPQTVLVSESGVNAVTSTLWGCTFQAPTMFTQVQTFTVTVGSLTLSPGQGIPGDTVTFTGGGFPAYTQVNRIDFNSPTGIVNIQPVPQPQVGANGNVTGTFIVPASIAGTATVVVWSGWGGATPAAGAATFNVMSGAATPAAVLAGLIANNQLSNPMWSFNNTTKAWDMYDPNDLPDSNITLFTPGTIYCIYVNATVELNWGINSYHLTPGVNCIGWLG